MHNILGCLWPIVFAQELSPNAPVVLAPPATDFEEEMERLAEHVAQNQEQGIRVRSTAEWIAGSAAPDLANARMYHKEAQIMIHKLQQEAALEYEVEERLKLDSTGTREFRLTNAAKGNLEAETLSRLGRVMQQTDVRWDLYTTWVGESAMSAFAAFRVGARMCGAIWIRFVMRQRAHPLQSFGLVREGCPDGLSEEIARYHV